MENYENPKHKLNGPKYRTGKKCINQNCVNEAGTAWSEFLCQPCNALRMKHIDSQLRDIAEKLGLKGE